MEQYPYGRFKIEEMTLRDYLAADRTVLSNERTLLSYVRTAMALAGGGVALIHFSIAAFPKAAGWVLIPVALSILAVGIQRFVKTKRRLDRCTMCTRG